MPEVIVASRFNLFAVELAAMVLLFSGCEQDSLRKYNYTVPEVPEDIPHYIRPTPGYRIYEQLDHGSELIDLHEFYLRGHKEGFRAAAQHWEINGEFLYRSRDDFIVDQPGEFVDGYWDGYQDFQKVPKDSGPTAEQDDD